MFSLILYIAIGGQIVATPAGNFDTMKQCDLKGQVESKSRKDVKKFICFDATRAVPNLPIVPGPGITK